MLEKEERIILQLSFEDFKAFFTKIFVEKSHDFLTNARDFTEEISKEKIGEFFEVSEGHNFLYKFQNMTLEGDLFSG